jgi:type II secretory pathway pseudopilin PulG
MTLKYINAGFTALEVAVMLAILGILSCVAIISANSFQQHALTQKASGDLFKINMAKMAWMMDHPGQDLPPDETDRQSALVNGHYLKYGIPVCPNNGTYTIGSVYQKPTSSLSGAETLP